MLAPLSQQKGRGEGVGVGGLDTMKFTVVPDSTIHYQYIECVSLEIGLFELFLV